MAVHSSSIVRTVAAFAALWAAQVSADVQTLRYPAEVLSVKPLVEERVASRPEKRCTWMIPTPHDRRIRKCTTRHVETVTETVRAYHVTYRVGEETFSTRLDYNPGATLLVQLTLEPLDADIPDDRAVQVAQNKPSDT